jgi:hypothetical protein
MEKRDAKDEPQSVGSNPTAGNTTDPRSSSDDIVVIETDREVGTGGGHTIYKKYPDWRTRLVSGSNEWLNCFDP